MLLKWTYTEYVLSILYKFVALGKEKRENKEGGGGEGGEREGERGGGREEREGGREGGEGEREKKNSRYAYG